MCFKRISNNQLANLPSEMGSLAKLREIVLSNNRLEL